MPMEFLENLGIAGYTSPNPLQLTFFAFLGAIGHFSARNREKRQLAEG